MFVLYAFEDKSFIEFSKDISYENFYGHALNEDQILLYLKDEKMIITVGRVFCFLDKNYVFINKNKGLCVFSFKEKSIDIFSKSIESSFKSYFKYFFKSILPKLKNNNIKLNLPLKKINFILFLIICLIFFIFIREQVAIAPVRASLLEKEKLKILVYMNLNQAMSRSSIKPHGEESKFKKLLGLTKKTSKTKEGDSLKTKGIFKPKVKKKLGVPNNNSNSNDPDILFFLKQESKK